MDCSSKLNSEFERHCWKTPFLLFILYLDNISYVKQTSHISQAYDSTNVYVYYEQ